MLGRFYFDWSYLYLILPAMLLALYAQSRVSTTFKKYSNTANLKGYTGADVAKQILNYSGIHDVTVEQIPGNLTDHYDPRSKVLRLSQSVYNSTSLAAVGVAAHETGHAIQDAKGYSFMKVRTALVPVTSIGSRFSMPLILIGILLGSFRGPGIGYTLVQLGIVLFTLAVLFALITLPVEFNASNRAIALLDEYGILTLQEIEPAKKVLNAAAMTYVAAAAVAIAQLLRLVLLFGRRNN